MTMGDKACPHHVPPGVWCGNCALERDASSARGLRSRRKGADFERKVVSLLRHLGFAAKRTLQSRGARDGADVAIPGYHVECKTGTAPNLWGAYRQARRDSEDTGLVPVVVAHRESPDFEAAVEVMVLPLAEGLRLLAVDSRTDGQSLDGLAREIVEWQAVTFPSATAESSLIHLMREAHELAARPFDVEEAADVFLMLVSTVERAGHGIGGFTEAVAAKLAKNRLRTWKAPDAHGVVEHDGGAR